jgi:hypothetical protein
LYQEIRSPASPLARLVAPENRAKYDAQVEVGFAVYTDSYYNNPDFPWYIGAKAGQSRLERMRENVGAALEISDEYVWLWTESAKWWPIEYYSHSTGDKKWRDDHLPNTIGKGRLIEEVMPGITKALRQAKDPLGESLKALDSLQKPRENNALVPKNLVVNGDFESSVPAGYNVGEAPPGFTSWKAEGSSGTITWDRTVGFQSSSSGKLQNVDGVLIQRVPVEVGKRYLITARAQALGNSVPVVTGRWSNDAIFQSWIDNQVMDFPKVAAGEWSRAAKVVTVPEGFNKITVLMGADNQKTNADICHFDDFGVYDLDALLK